MRRDRGGALCHCCDLVGPSQSVCSLRGVHGALRIRLAREETDPNLVVRSEVGCRPADGALGVGVHEVALGIGGNRQRAELQQVDQAHGAWARGFRWAVGVIGELSAVRDLLGSNWPRGGLCVLQDNGCDRRKRVYFRTYLFIPRPKSILLTGHTGHTA